MAHLPTMIEASTRHRLPTREGHGERVTAMTVSELQGLEMDVVDTDLEVAAISFVSIFVCE